MAEPDALRSAGTAPRRRGSLKRRLLFLALLFMGLDAAGWLDDYIFNHRQRLLSALVMMRLATQPIPARSDTSNDRELVLRDPADGPGAAEPYQIGGVEISGAGHGSAHATSLPQPWSRNNHRAW